jgi:CheY-like chemotaxis protein
MEEAEKLLLVVDDDEDDQEFVQFAIEKAKLPLNALYFSNGVELMNYLQPQEQDQRDQRLSMVKLILLDLNMPIKDGWEVLKELSTDPKLKSTPVVILSTSSYDRDMQFGKEMGVSGFLTKPIYTEDWVRILRFIYNRWFG